MYSQKIENSIYLYNNNNNTNKNKIKKMESKIILNAYFLDG